jgi:hypothetical protein
MGIGAAIAGVGSLVSGVIGSSAATSAANTQAQAAENAANLQYKAFEQTQANLQPFVSAGTGALSSLQKLTGTNAASGPAAPSWASSTAAATADQVQQAYQDLLGRGADPSGLSAYVGKPLNEIYSAITGGSEYTTALANGTVPGSTPAGNPLTAALTAPFASTPGAQQAALEATPGYKFTLGQGLEATQNSYAAQGLGASGAALKGAANYSEGLASTTYQQMFNNYLTQNQQIYNMLGQQVGVGESAAATAGNQAIGATSNIGNTLTSGAAATAGGTIGAANAITGATANTTALGLLAANNSGLFGSSAGGTQAVNDTSNGLQGTSYGPTGNSIFVPNLTS